MDSITTPGAIPAIRTLIRVEGIVQGVGFRPFVYALAARLGLCGYVANDQRGVIIEVEGAEPKVAEFIARLQSDAPVLASVDRLSATQVAALGEGEFRITGSRAEGAQQTLIAPDTATCDGCLREIFDPSDRRYRYPFTNCTNCGPRFTIIRDTPYDRPFTTMAGFAMCALCAREYHDPGDRRFHAQPISCPDCGPRLQLIDGRDPHPDPLPGQGEGVEIGQGEGERKALAGEGERDGKTLVGLGVRHGPATDPAHLKRTILSPLPGQGEGEGEGDALIDKPRIVIAEGKERPGDPIDIAARLLAAGHIVAIKGLGGYHLAAVAADEAAVSTLRERKHREDKPFAVMAADIRAARQLAFIDEAEARALSSARRPIVLVRRRPRAPLAGAVAPGNRFVGVMLPYTPLHHLLSDALGEPLVLTSGNVSDEPIA